MSAAGVDPGVTLRIEPRSGPVLIHRPPRARALAAGLSLVAACLVVAAAATLTFEQRYPDPSAVAFAVLAAASAGGALVAAYYTAGVARLRYAVRDFHLWIDGPGGRYRIPLADVTAVVPGSEAGRLNHRRGLLWWGLTVGRARAEALGPVVLLAAGTAAERLTFVVTPSITIGLAIDPASDLATALATRRPIRRAGEWARAEPGRWRSASIVADGTFRGLALAGILTAALAWALALGRQGLFPAGHPVFLGSIAIGRGEDLIALVVIGVALWAVDLFVALLLHPSEHRAARALVAAGWLAPAITALALLPLYRA